MVDPIMNKNNLDTGYKYSSVLYVYGLQVGQVGPILIELSTIFYFTSNCFRKCEDCY
jgi:hypothetical protein